MEEIVELLKEKKETISTMESCTGGYIVNEITNIPGASDVLSFSAITYSNEFKIKMGVSKEIIDKYSVYSIETAIAMATAICKYTNSTYGIGITGQLNKIDKNNISDDYSTIYICIHNSKTSSNKTITMQACEQRKESKIKIGNVVKTILKSMLQEEVK